MIKTVIPMLLVVLQYTAAIAIEPRINILPDTIVEVGDEVFFSANGTTGLLDPFLAYYEWDFGDGYALKRGSPFSYSAYTGANCLHYFMKPGTFVVKLLVTDSDSTKVSAQVNITVSGEAPISGFELWRAPYHGRIAQYIYAQIPSEISANAGNNLRVRLIRNKQDTTILYAKNKLKSEEKFLLKNSELPSGDYELLAELLNNSMSRISYIKENFSKTYEGSPKIGINEHNAICINGEPFFPVTPWLGDKPIISNWAKKYINCSYGEGYYASHDVSTWSDYINLCSMYGLQVIGPERWEGKGPLHYEKNSDIRKMSEYVNETKNSNEMMMWMWDDEPNGSGRPGRIPPSVNAAWTHTCHSLDPHHLVTANYYGYGYLPHYNSAGDDYDYLNNEIYFGGKKHTLFDVIGFDIYPIQAAEHASMKGRRIISEYAEAIDFFQKQNYHLVPAMSFIEVQKLKNSPIAPSYDQILMEAWLNVIHGIKGINWFHYFGTTPQESLDAMELFYKQITKYSRIVLSAPSAVQVTDDANNPGHRVDQMIRKKGDGADSSVYIFAVRVTEPDSATANYVQKEIEPDSIIVNFTISGVTNDTIMSDLDNRKIPVRNGTFQDTFRKCQVRVYRLGKDVSLQQKGRAKQKNLRSELVTIPKFKTAFKLLNSPNLQSTVSFYSLEGKLIEKVQVHDNVLNPVNVNRSGTYIIKQDATNFGKKVILVR